MADHERRALLSPEERANEDPAKELDVLKQLALMPESARPVFDALRIESRRDLAYSEIERETTTGREREARKLQAVIDALEQGERLSEHEADELRRHYESGDLAAEDLQSDRRWLWSRHAGDDLRWFRKRVKAG